MIVAMTCVPLLGRQVDAGRVVAAGVQHDDGAGRRGGQLGDHRVEGDAAGGRVVVRVLLDGEAGVGEQRAVVLPARVADQHLGVGMQALEEIGADLQAAGAAQGLDGGDAALLDDVGVGAEHQALHGLVVGGDAVDGQVAARLLQLDQLLLGRGHAGQQRQLAVLVGIDADAQVDLGRVGVGVELLVQAEDGVTRGEFDGGKQRHGVRFLARA